MKPTVKNKKVLILGLPKSGTSTMATMLRMLGYRVTGPNPYIQDFESLKETFDAYEAFQDYPWCFEYPTLLKNIDTKVIVLKRDKESWVKSFKESYGGEDKNYLSYKFMKLSKNESDSVFYDYHINYYEEALTFLIGNKLNYIEISLSNLSWKSVCEFLNTPIPKNMFGMVSKIPRVNSKNYRKTGSFFFIFKKHLKKQLHTILGKKYFKLTSFIYRNR